MSNSDIQRCKEAIDAVFFRSIEAIDQSRKTIHQQEQAQIKAAVRDLEIRLAQLGLPPTERANIMGQLEWEVRKQLPGK